jgi:tetratricopeptide (TPR) repeat protein
VMRNLLPGNDQTRDRWASGISIAVGVAGAYVMLTRFDNLFAAFLFGWVVFMNVGIFRSAGDDGTTPVKGSPARSRDASSLADTLGRLTRGDSGMLAQLHQQLANTAEASVRNAAKSYAIEQLLRHWRPVEARQAIDHLPGAVPASMYALVSLVQGDGDHALAALDELLERDPSPVTARHAALGRVLLRRSAEVPGVLGPLPDPLVPFEVVRELQFLAHDFGDVVGSAMVGEFAVARFGPDPTTLYNIACSWARAAQYDRAIACLHRAVDAGWRDRSQLDADPDLAPLRGSPDYEAIRATLPSASFT